MKTKSVFIIGFVLMVLIQLGLPVKMIWDREDILSQGKEFKFETEPIDPNDPFRGKYIVLNYLADWVPVEDKSDWEYGETVYALIGEDERGYAHFISASKNRPNPGTAYLKTTVGSGFYTESTKLPLKLDFYRLYMDEYEAPKAEALYADSQVDSTFTAYGLVVIKEGEAVLKDVMIDGTSIREMVEESN
jgi:hypothetical protein